MTGCPRPLIPSDTLKWIRSHRMLGGHHLDFEWNSLDERWWLVLRFANKEYRKLPGLSDGYYRLYKLEDPETGQYLSPDSPLVKKIVAASDQRHKTREERWKESEKESEKKAQSELKQMNETAEMLGIEVQKAINVVLAYYENAKRLQTGPKCGVKGL